MTGSLSYWNNIWNSHHEFWIGKDISLQSLCDIWMVVFLYSAKCKADWGGSMHVLWCVWINCLLVLDLATTAIIQGQNSSSTLGSPLLEWEERMLCWSYNYERLSNRNDSWPINMLLQFIVALLIKYWP